MLNPWLNDGCGRFKVRHFGVATSSQFSSFSIIKQIRRIVSENRDIKVWNISLGSDKEINDNFISAEASVLDQIQFENDIIFVIAGTNKSNETIRKIGSPADSINSLVVNAVTKSGISTKYSRTGLALSFLLSQMLVITAEARRNTYRFVNLWAVLPLLELLMLLPG